jgi:hypothetical protein
MQKRPDTVTVTKTELGIIRQVRLDVGPTDISRDYFAYALQRSHSLSHALGAALDDAHRADRCAAPVDFERER